MPIQIFLIILLGIVGFLASANFCISLIKRKNRGWAFIAFSGWIFALFYAIQLYIK